jgi:hypothetical protein
MQGACAFPREVTDSSRCGTRHIERDAEVTSNSVAFSASSMSAVAIASLSPRLVASSQPERINLAVTSGATSKLTTTTPCRLLSRHRRVRSAPEDNSTGRIEISRIASAYALLTPAGLPDWPGFHMRARIAGCSPGCGLMDCQNMRENSGNRLLMDTVRERARCAGMCSCLRPAFPRRGASRMCLAAAGKFGRDRNPDRRAR